MIMKKTLLVILCCLFSITIQAQTEHLKFMGIPIDGKIIQFHRSLSQKGLTRVTNQSDFCMYEGVFAGNNATIFVKKEPKEDSVYSVIVAIPCFNIKNSQSQYEEFKYKLIRKYNCISDTSFVEKINTNAKDLFDKVNEGLLSLNTYFEEKIDGKEKTTICVEKNDSWYKNFSLLENVNDSNRIELIKSLIKLQYYLMRGSVGRIVITRGQFESLGESYNHAVIIAYIDEENNRKNEEKKDDDL